MKALIIEDDERIAEPLKDELEHQQFLVHLAFDGETGLAMGLEDHYDVILLDWMLPKLDGLQICRRLRKAGVKAPVVMLTAKDHVASKIEGLDSGADAYLVKPFEPDELLASIRAVIRRTTQSRQPLLKWRRLSIDPATCEVRHAGFLVELSPTEFRLLVHFLRYPGQIFSKDELITRLWLHDETPSYDVIKTHIKGLRLKLERVGVSRDLIETFYGFGYRLGAENDETVETP